MASHSSDLPSVRLHRRALPERDLAAVSLRTVLLGRTLDAPLMGDFALAELLAGDVRGRDGLWRAAEAVAHEADGLSILLDPSADHPEYSGVRDGIAAVVAHIAPAPVVVRGQLEFEDVVLLRDTGIAAIELYITTAEGLTEARAAAPGLPLIAGSLTNGRDVAKAIALGASAARLVPSADVATVVEELRVVTWLAGVGHVQELGREHLV